MGKSGRRGACTDAVVDFSEHYVTEASHFDCAKTCMMCCHSLWYQSAQQVPESGPATMAVTNCNDIMHRQWLEVPIGLQALIAPWSEATGTELAQGA